MTKLIHRNSSRGEANHGWLHSFHSFSFADYFNPQKMGFGALRVLNDDRVAPGMGFPTHPHRDMEIVSIPLQGSLRHKDSEGNEQEVSAGEVQLMSAGTGVLHSEYNGSQSDQVNFLQIWILPEEKGIAPRYDQRRFNRADRLNVFQTVVSPMGTPSESLHINQQAYFSMADLDGTRSVTYEKHNPNNGIYLFVIEGEASVLGEVLGARDALAMVDGKDVVVSSSAQAELLLIEVPLKA